MKIGFEYHITDLKEEVKRAAKEQIIMGLIRCGKKMRDFAQERAPKVTGELRRSISYEINPEDTVGPSVTVGSTSEYATYVELDTGEYSEVGGKPGGKRWTYKDPATGEMRIAGGQRPQPYIRPSVKDHINTYKNILIDALKGND